MKTSRASRGRRLLARTLMVLVVAVALFVAWAAPRAGRYLIVDTAQPSADVIVVLAGTRAERWLEAVDLYKEKYAPLILLSSGRIEKVELRLRERGIRFPLEVELVEDAMVQLGVPETAIQAFPEPVDNTAAEAVATRRLAAERGWRRLIVVTSKYHTRRSLFAFEREFRGTGVQIQMRGTRYDESKPDEWWKHRPDVRFVLSELEKLLLYRLGLGE